MMVSDWQGAILRSYQVRTTQVDTRNADQGIPGDWNPVQIDGTGSGGQRVQGIVGNLSVFNQVLDEDGLPTPWRQVVTLPAKSLDVPFLGWPDFRAWIARVIVALAAVREDVHLPPRLGDIAFSLHWLRRSQMETRRLEVNRQRRAHDPEYLPCAPIFHQFRWDHYDQCRGKLIGGSGDADLEVHQGADAACPWNSQLDLNSTNFLLISVGFDLIAHQDEATEGTPESAQKRVKRRVSDPEF
ncbi:hypothetical protein WJX84_006454 [Apatococcus fuscideae]|uniref:Uncharacterized protein n=1 Tax=Apatococcus fuscideae TaxID=2026836 RepID=A0AAW1T9L1_9CHLO